MDALEMKMARNDEELGKEIRRIQGQLLVAKQICRENVFIHRFLLLIPINFISNSLKK
jgi:hypothetical protein